MSSLADQAKSDAGKIDRPTRERGHARIDPYNLTNLTEGVAESNLATAPQIDLVLSEEAKRP